MGVHGQVLRRHAVKVTHPARVKFHLRVKGVSGKMPASRQMGIDPADMMVDEHTVTDPEIGQAGTQFDHFADWFVAQDLGL